MFIRRVGAALAVPIVITNGFCSGDVSHGFLASSYHVELCHIFSRTAITARVKRAFCTIKKLPGTNGVDGKNNARGASINSSEGKGCDETTRTEERIEGAEEIVERLVREKSEETAVFYNRVGALSRDLSVLMASVFAEERLKERHRADLTINRGVSGPDGETRRPNHGKKPADSIHAAKKGGGDELQEEQQGLMVLDAFAASGVRALRYLTEVPGICKVVANDYDTSAIELMSEAANLCGVGEEFEVQRGDALDVMYAARAKGLGTYDIVDIDPYGESAPFLDASVQAVKDGGLLCITSTDMSVLSGVQYSGEFGKQVRFVAQACSSEPPLRLRVRCPMLNYAVPKIATKPEAAFARYGSVPARGGHHQEMSLRVLLYATSAAATRQRRSIKPVLSVAVDHYVRVFVRVFRSPKAALVAARTNISYVLQSETCPSYFVIPVLAQQSTPGATHLRSPTTSVRPVPDEDRQSSISFHKGDDSYHWQEAGIPPLGGRCPETGGALRTGGPIWSGPLHDEAWVARAIILASGGGASVSSKTHQSNDGSFPLAEAKGTKRPAQSTTQPRPRLVARPRVESLLGAVSRELQDVPLFYNLRDMFATLGLRFSPQREQVMSALETAGYRTSGMHKEPLALKTDAPDAAVWDVLRCWVRDNPQPPPARSAGRAILARGPKLINDANFETGRAGVDGKKIIVKGGFLHICNPEAGWGPLPRGSVTAATAAVSELGAETRQSRVVASDEDREKREERGEREGA